MTSGYPTAEEVLEDLGEKVADGLSLMVAQTREDLRVYRSTFPGWAAESTDRGLLNWCHDRLWIHTVRLFDGIGDVVLVDKAPLREICVKNRYRLRLKKHDLEGSISTYLTQGALEFLEQTEQQLAGLEEVRLIAGYRWDEETRQIGAAVISLRDGLKNVIWTHELPEPEAGSVVSTLPVVPTEPSTPEITIGTEDEKRTSDEQ